MKKSKITCDVSGPLGRPLPDSPHAVSVSMPAWEDVIGYEEDEPNVLNALNSGYPRFFYHPKVAELFAHCKIAFCNAEQEAIALPSEKSAIECQKFLKKEKINSTIHPYGKENIYVICFPASAQKKVKEFWQHTGLIITSRLAEDLLLEQPSNNKAEEEKTQIKTRIGHLCGETINNVYLFPSGMAAIFSAYKLLCSLSPGNKTIQLGFPYVDTLKIQEKFGSGVHFISGCDIYDIEKIEEILKKEKISALFCEFPSNPLLISVDLQKLSKILREYNVPLVIDDTIATSLNIDVTDYADIIVTSLTKFFSGSGDVIAGSLVLNSASPFYDDMNFSINNLYEDLFYSADAITLEKNSRDFTKRLEQINHTAEELCDWLKKCPEVKEIYYPKYITKELYKKYLRDGGGYGGLFSIKLKDSSKAPEFYNMLDISKGPNLGTNFTIACPYTLLAHYHELDFAKKCEVDADLIRISVGLENIKSLIKIFEKALSVL